MNATKELKVHVANALFNHMFPERKGEIYEDEHLYLCYYGLAEEAIKSVDIGRAIEADIAKYSTTRQKDET